MGRSRSASSRKRALLLIVALAGAAALVTTSYVLLAGGEPRVASPSDGNGERRPPGPTGSAIPPPKDTATGRRLETGTVEPATFSFGPCPRDHTCTAHSVACPSVADAARVAVAVAPAEGDPLGIAVLLSGGGGRDWWAEEGATQDFLSELREGGLAVVQVRWKDEWLGASRGETAGPHRLACRSATVLRWIHDNVYAHLGVTDTEPRRCGFCVSGTSGGASQLAYALAFYGLDDVVDGAFPTGGPPHAAIHKGCLRDPAEEEYWYVGASTQTIDTSWGFRGGGGPCMANDPSWEDAWRAASVDVGGADYAHPDTRIVAVLGERDRVGPHVRDYVRRLRDAGTEVPLEIVPGMGHSIAESPDGLELLAELLLA